MPATRVVSYDARGHGESDPAPEGQGYGYPELVGDLEAVVAATVGEERFVLGGHSMGAHTAVAYALRHPERLSGLVVIGPVYMGEISAESLAYWDGLAAALEAGGVDGFVDYIDRDQGIDPAWRDSVLRFTRERMLRHRHLDGRGRGAAGGAALAAVRADGRAGVAPGPGAGRRQPRRRRPRPSPRTSPRPTRSACRGRG